MSLALLPFALLLPGSRPVTNVAKLVLISALVTGFFLFTGRVWFPGGAEQFMAYAEAVAHDATLPPDLTQWDAGYPLLIILSGYTLLHSIIPIFLLQAAFAITLPLLIYEALKNLSPTMAYYTGLTSVMTLAPIYFMKMIYHDQTYIFFSVLMLCLLLKFVQTRQSPFLYGFTFAAIAASITREAGNALFPVFLAVAFISVRGRISRYSACVAIFGLFLTGYSWHRYEIFDMKNAPRTPSYTGEQLFYNPYLNTLDYGIVLSPAEVGPSLALAAERLRSQLLPSPRDSKFISAAYSGWSAAQEFVERNITPFTSDELMNRVFRNPNWEYYALLCRANDDKLMLEAAWEIARAYPGLVFQYSARNVFYFVFTPGYKHLRLSQGPITSEPLVFRPADGLITAGAAGLPARAVRELNFDALSHQPVFVRKLFDMIQSAWLSSYMVEIWVVDFLMCATWVAAIGSLLAYATRQQQPSVSSFKSKLGNMFKFSDGFLPSIVAASLLFGYNAIVTAVFAEPNFRYRTMVQLHTFLIGGLGLISIRHWVLVVFEGNVRKSCKRWADTVHSVRTFDFFERLTGFQLAALSISLPMAVFAWWVIFMLKYTAQMPG